MSHLTIAAIDMPAGPELVDQIRRSWDDGEVIFVLDQRLGRQAQEELVRRFGATKLVSTTGVEQLTPNQTTDCYLPGDALVMPTSGSTGEPKGVVLTHAAIEASSRITSEAIGIEQDDRWLCCLPPSHIGGFSVISRALHLGLQLEVLNKFDADAVTLAAQNGATLTSLVNTTLRRINPLIFRKILLGGSAPLKNPPKNAIATYGMTETASGVIYNGKPLAGVEVRCDSDGQILLRTPTMFRRYIGGSPGHPDIRDESPLDADRWFTTGDVGEFSNGLLTICGRLDDVIITGGEKVWPAQVEAVLTADPRVNGALVFGEEDTEWDMRVVAHVELNPKRVDLDQQSTINAVITELRGLVKEQVANYAAPKHIKVVDRLELTRSGKIKRPFRKPRHR